MSIADLKSIVPSYLKDVWYLNPVAIWTIKDDLNNQPNSKATTSLSVYKQFYK